VDERPGLSTALRRGTLEFCVLACLAGGERYGVELVRELGAETALATSEGTLYPLLSRRYYTLTPDGRAALASFKIEWAGFRDAVDRIVGTESR
jgi:PadR family transcriptional regulator PadR